MSIPFDDEQIARIAAAADSLGITSDTLIDKALESQDATTDTAKIQAVEDFLHSVGYSDVPARNEDVRRAMGWIPERRNIDSDGLDWGSIDD